MNKRLRTILLVTLLVILTAGAYGVYYAYNVYDSMEVTPINTDKGSLGIRPESENKINLFKNSKEVINILLLGTDKREPEETSRSDSMMILSIDPVSDNIKISSLMRDSYVSIKGRGNNKLGHAYAYGGPELAINTVNTNFDMNIEYYAVINYGGLINVIDALGGVEVDIKDYEIDMVNGYIRDVGLIESVPFEMLEHTGMQTLTGVQAVGYARVRYAGDGDFERTERQRNVLQSMFRKFTDLSATQIPAVAAKLAPNVETNISLSNMIRISSSVYNAGIRNVMQARFPTDDHARGRMLNAWFYVFDKEETVEELHNFIYDNEIPRSQVVDVEETSETPGAD